MSAGSLSIGIDFGTTNSAMAWYNLESKQAEIILNAEGEPKTPSLVYFGEDQILVGKAVEDLLEDSKSYDEEERLDATQRIVKSIKRDLVNPPFVPIPGREPVRPAEVVAEILGKLKRDAEEEHFQEEVYQAVITYPAVFGAQQRKVLFDAAALVGFKVVDLVEEPVAAAIAFARLGRKVGRGILVYDLGGGTFDLAVVAREEEEGEETFRVAMEPDGDDRCGGDDFDRALYDHCERLARKELGRSVSEIEGVVNPYFLNECRKQKERLTLKDQVAVREYLDGTLFKASLDREIFEGLIGDEVEKTVRKAATMVERVKGRGHEVDTVVLIGGSSRVPLVDRRLKETLGVEPRKFANKDYAVALGAAYYADVLEIPAEQRYRTALEISWVDAKLNREEVEHLKGLLEELELGKEEAARIEREVLDATVEEVLNLQREKYRKAAHEIWEAWRGLDALAAELGLDGERAAGIQHEITDEGTVPIPGSENLSAKPPGKSVHQGTPDEPTKVPRSGGTQDGDVPDGLRREKLYRDEVVKVWRDGHISNSEVDRLTGLGRKLGLSEDQAAAIERAVMGSAKKSIKAEQKEQKAVRKLALDYGVDLSQISGTGRKGRVTRRDVERYIDKVVRPK